MLEIEKVYNRPMDFELAMKVPLHRLDQLMTQEADAPAPTDNFDRPGVLLTGATGFLGGHVLAQAARDLLPNEVVYCLVRDKNRSARDRLDEIAALHGVTEDRYVMVPGTLDASDFGLEASAIAELASSVTRVIHCAAMVNLAIGRKEMLEWSARGIDTVLTFCKSANADLCFTSSSAVFPDQGGPWPEGPATEWAGCTGYGAAKIATEEAIRTAGIPVAIVRLPSLYDLNAPNSRDIYEIILRASLQAGQFPNGLAFPMTDVTAAAAFLLGAVTSPNAPFYNLMTDEHIVPKSIGGLCTQDWLEAVELEPGIAKVISDFPDTLCANATFENCVTRATWARISNRPYCDISDADALLTRRAQNYQSDPALI